ncbi:IPT/TIG domain-containing protein [Streptomyces sp. TLI_235]|nr:IPT/TIG domain-containing protein [Streptomyces sp. TLI_235]PBC69736.1 IPT/TIG domain-containing protein [Streptomyces sp. TLI_235]
MGTSKDPHPSSGPAAETSPAPSIATVLLASPPTLSSLTPGQGPAGGGTIVTLTGTNLTGASAVTFGSTAATSYTVVSPSQITATAPAGSGTVQVKVTTADGTSNGLSFTYVPAPALSSLTPIQGTTGGGTIVTLTGTNLTGASAVTFGSTPATSYTVVSPSQITATAPPGPAGPVQTTVTTAGGTSNGLAFFLLNAPTLTAVTPSQGPGGSVVLTGTNLLAASGVSFGGTPAVSFSVISSTQISALAPTGSGTVAITVTTPGGTSNGVPFTYVPSPSLNAVTPIQGPTAGGAQVTLTGTNLTSVTAVAFGTSPATSFTVVSATQITAVAPPGTAGPVQVSVTSPGGTSGGLAYYYTSAPTLTSVTPSQGPTAGGTAVTLAGTNFSNATAVAFGTAAAASFSVVSATQINAVAPPGTAGPVQIKVTTPGGTSNGLAYFFLNAPTLTSVTPSQGPTAAGTAVTLVGTNLTNATTVTFGSTAATSFTVVSATQINATAPAGTGTVNVTATTPGGTSNGQPYTYLAAPTLTSINPVQGPLAGGITVTLVGTNLTNATAVTFGSTAATSFTPVSATQINAVAPAGSAGPVQVTVTTPGGTSNSLTHTRIQAPAI